MTQPNDPVRAAARALVDECRYVVQARRTGGLVMLSDRAEALRALLDSPPAPTSDASQEQRESARILACASVDGCVGNVTGQHHEVCDARASVLADLFAERESDATVAAMEEACRAVCIACRSPLERLSELTPGRWVHTYSTLSDEPCHASAIRSLMASRAGTAGGGE